MDHAASNTGDKALSLFRPACRMDTLDKQLSQLNDECKEVTSTIEQLYGRKDSEQNPSVREELLERMVDLRKRENELNDRRRKLEDKLQPGGMRFKG